jgi:hypothetical protein
VNNWYFFLQCYSFPLFLTLAYIFVTIGPTSFSRCLEIEWTTFYINRASYLNTPSHTDTGKMWPAGTRATQSRHHCTRWLQNYCTIFSLIFSLNRVIAKTRKVRSRITRVACSDFEIHSIFQTRFIVRCNVPCLLAYSQSLFLLPCVPFPHASVQEGLNWLYM